ncbi:MAG TPA: hypothetical protein VGG74_01815 [Kofleriaceae bacterium]|jgi:hypothetical protein
MNRISDLMTLCVFFAAACGNAGGNNMKPDGGRNGSGGSGSSILLGDNASVPMTCQTCLSMSTNNECDNRGEVCADDPDCVALNKCVNNCTNINAACIQSCGDAASANAITEWTDWTNCTCGTCATQCNATFCNIGGSGTMGSNTGACIADNNSCASNEACCTFCASDGYCGCIPSNNNGCESNSDCCSGYCDQGYCD